MGWCFPFFALKLEEYISYIISSSSYCEIYLEDLGTVQTEKRDACTATVTAYDCWYVCQNDNQDEELNQWHQQKRRISKGVWSLFKNIDESKVLGLTSSCSAKLAIEADVWGSTVWLWLHWLCSSISRKGYKETRRVLTGIRSLQLEIMWFHWGFKGTEFSPLKPPYEHFHSK